VSFTKNIFLVGMPGSGKSTVGKLLAEKLELDFYDLDNEIEKAQGRTIAEVFSEGGEDLFRKIEAEMLINTISNKDSLVIAAGGGTPCFYDGIKVMNESGVTVYLETPIELLISRTKRKQHRPLLSENHAEKMKLLLSTRQNCYAQANYIVNTGDLGLQEKVSKIIMLLTDNN
jgi:shikimate kinase